MNDNDTAKKRKNVSIAILKNKQKSVGDPMMKFGLMTLNNHIPYKRPVLKQMPVYVNARGVLQELKEKHGGIYSTKTEANNSDNHINNCNSKNPGLVTAAMPKSSFNKRLASAIVNGRIQSAKSPYALFEDKLIKEH